MNEERFDQLIIEAKRRIPFDLERAGLGLETRVVARLRAKIATDDLLARWVWRGAFGVAPAVALLVAWFCVWNGFSAETIVASDAARDLTAYLPLSFR